MTCQKLNDIDKALERFQITRLDITMQPFIQHIFSQIFIFLKGSVISLEKVALGNKTNFFFLVHRVFGQKFTRNAKNGFEYLKLI